MATESQHSPTSPRPIIRVLIVGGSTGGLATAIAFRRAGHEAYVFEARETIAPAVTGSTRLPPNVTKILYHWGYERRLRKIGRTSAGVDIILMNTGERLGRHVWEEELIRDARGDFVFCDYEDFAYFLHDIAEENGAVLHYGTKVTEVNLEQKQITLANGQTFTGDIIVGADGPNGICRPMFDSHEQEALVNVYSTTIPRELIVSDPVTTDLYDPKHGAVVSAWFDDGVAALGWPQKRDEYALFIYGPPEGPPTGWLQQESKDRMLKILRRCEPRLQKLGEWAREPHVVPVLKGRPLSDWYHVDGPLALVGHAAQPLPAGAVQEAALAFEDGITLGRIFSRLKRREQIPSFLEAYEDVRRERDIKTYKKELGDLDFMTLPPEYAESRNSVLREKGKDGKNLFEVYIPTDDGTSSGWEEWQSIIDQFAYNAEDAADDWWQSEGKVIEASRGGVVDGPVLQILVAQNTKEN